MGSNIRQNILSNILVIIAILVIIVIAIYANSNRIFNKIGDTYKDNLQMIHIEKKLSIAHIALENYMSDKSTNSFIEFKQASQELQKEALSMMQKSFLQGEKYLIKKNIYNMIISYLDFGENAIKEKRARNINACRDMFLQSEKVLNYIRIYCVKLNLQNINQDSQEYMVLNKKVEVFNIISQVTVGAIFIINIIYMWFFANQVASPINTLAIAASNISKGNYDLSFKIKADILEVNLLSQALERMTNRFKENIQQLKEKSMMQTKLKEQEITNLRIKHLLEETEIKVLQAQINPHFLFNALNVGVHMAILEDAEQTADYMHELGQLLRYNLKSIDRTVTLQEECENVKNYVYLMNTRYKGREITLDIVCKEEVLQTRMPSMILQPIVENAIIHGLKQSRNGIITIMAKIEEGLRVITIQDNGMGIPQELCDRLLDDKQLKEEDKKSEGGLGLLNVKKRLELYFNAKNVIELKSRIGEGTQVRLYLATSIQEIMTSES